MRFFLIGALCVMPSICFAGEASFEEAEHAYNICAQHSNPAHKIGPGSSTTSRWATGWESDCAAAEQEYLAQKKKRDEAAMTDPDRKAVRDLADKVQK